MIRRSAGAARRQQQRDLGELFQRDRLAARQTEPAVSEQQQVLGEQGVDLQLGLVDRQVQDRRIDLRGLQAGEQAAGVALVDRDVHARVGSADLAEQLRQQPAGGRADDAEAGVAGDLVAPRRHFGGEVLQLVQDPPGTIDDDDALVGQAATLAIDQRDAQLTLEAGDVAADVGLHGVERTSGGGERAVVGDRHERGQLAEIHLRK